MSVCSYRQQRLSLVRSNLPSFGTYMRCENVQELATYIKGTHELAFVVVHVYENHVPNCARLHLILEDVARQFPMVCFVRVMAQVL